MKKIFPQKIYFVHYYPQYICLRELSALFDLEDRPELIDIIITDKPTKESYKAETSLYPSGEINGIYVTLSDGRIRFYTTSASTDKLLKTLPKTFYVSVRA